MDANAKSNGESNDVAVPELLVLTVFFPKTWDEIGIINCTPPSFTLLAV